MPRVFVAGLMALVLAGPLLAQGGADSAQITSDCRLAVRIITNGKPSSQEEWAWSVIQLCGSDGGNAVATALRNARSSSDVDYLDRLAGTGRWLRDGNFFAAALDVAGDRSATVTARLRALIVLLYATRLAQQPIRGVPISSRDLLSAFDEHSGLPRPTCGLGRVSTGEVPPYDGSPMPTDYEAKIAALATRIFRDTTEPQDVRSAVFCLM
jgi:hypothetical protein